jgi:type IV pilus assembly protein PilN
MSPTISKPPVLDLLRERRRALGIDSMTSVLGQRRDLVRQGALIGAALLGGMALITAAVALRHRFIQAEIAKLAPIEAEVRSLTETNSSRYTALSKITTTNKDLATALTTVRTSSALLADLQLRTPKGVQLTSAVVQGRNLVIKGKAEDPTAFSRINALLLELKRSALFDPAAISLVRSERAAAPNQGEQLLAPPAPVAFEINASFSMLEPKQQLGVLQNLRSDGMARRLQLLQREGLLP